MLHAEVIPQPTYRHRNITDYTLSQFSVPRYVILHIPYLLHLFYGKICPGASQTLANLFSQYNLTKQLAKWLSCPPMRDGTARRLQCRVRPSLISTAHLVLGSLPEMLMTKLQFPQVKHLRPRHTENTCIKTLITKTNRRQARSQPRTHYQLATMT